MTSDRKRDLSDTLLRGFDFAAEMTAREKEHEERTRALLLSLLDVADSFDRFFAAVDQIEQPTPEQATQWRKTIHLISKKLQIVLNNAALEPIECLGRPADPNRHQIGEARPASEVEEGLIIEEILRGYEWNGKLLRRPCVVVAIPAEEEKA